MDLRLLSVSFVAVAGAALPAAGAPPSPSPSPTPIAASVPESVLMPRGTLIVVKTRHGINSYGLQSGVKVTYEVVQDVVVNGYLFVKAGDTAEGVIESAQQGENDFFTYKAANLRLSVDTVFNFCGDKIDADFERSEYRRRQGAFGSHKDVEIIKGQMYQVPTERSERVCAEKSTEQPSPVPSNALQGDKN